MSAACSTGYEKRPSFGAGLSGPGESLRAALAFMSFNLL